MAKDLEKLIEIGELSREQDDFETALVHFDRAIIEAIKQSNFPSAINALGHHLLVFDRMYKQTKNIAFLEMMYMDSQAGLRLAEKNNVHGQPLALMQMRTAEYYLQNKDFSQAESKYQLAYDELVSDSTATNEEKAEYLGHLAESIIYGGDVERAEPLFQQAHQLLAQSSDNIREFHRLIIESGLLMREAYGLYINQQVDKAKSILMKIEPLVNKLKDTHKMDARFKEWVELRAKINP
jgi:hypothetical protein